MSSPCYCAILRSAGRRLTAAYDAALAPAGVTLAQYSLLRNVERRAPVSLTEIGRLCGLDRSTVGRNVRVLQRRGLLAAVPGKDLREATVALTEAGTAILERAAPLWERAQREVESTLGSGAAAHLKTLLNAL